MPLIDYASTLRAGQNLVPDFRLQAMQDEQFAMQREEHELRREAMEEQRRAAAEARKKAAAFQTDFERVMMAGGKPDDITGLMLRYPGMMDQYKPVLDRMDKQQLEADITQTGSIYSRLNAGDAEGAAAVLRRRVEADREAGMVDPQDEALLRAIESGDERELKIAQSMIGTQLAAMTGVDTFKAVYGGSEQTNPVQKEYDWRVKTFGKAAADRWLATEDTSLVTVEPGGSVYNKSDFVNGGTPPATQGGGDPSGSGASVTLPFKGASFDQAAQQYGASRGNRAHNGLDFSGTLGTPVQPVLPGEVVAVGSDGRSGNFVKVKHADGRVSSYSHLGNVSVGKGDSVDASTSLGTLGRTGNVQAGEGRGVLHFVMRGADGKPVDPAPLFGGPVRVRSVQEARSLPAGTEFITPDGRRMRR